MTFRQAKLSDFTPLETPDLARSSYKNIAYPLGCSVSELDVALGKGDYALEDDRASVVGFTRIKAMFEGLCYLDVHLLREDGADDALDDLLCSLEDTYDVGKYYVQLLPYEQRERNCLKRLDFVEEACLREQIFLDGRYHDLLVVGSEDNRV